MNPPDKKHHAQAFKMKLLSGFAQEYERRHNELWPEMAQMIHDYGGHNYSIFIDADNETLFGYIETDDADRYAQSAATQICRRWWTFMADIMETNPDDSPVQTNLRCVFHLE